MARTKKKLQDEQRMELERFLASQRRGGRGRGRGRPRGSGRGGSSPSHAYPLVTVRQADPFPATQPSPVATTQTEPELVSATSLPSATHVASTGLPVTVSVSSSEPVSPGQPSRQSPRKVSLTDPQEHVMEGLVTSSSNGSRRMKPTARKSTAPKRLLASCAAYMTNDSTGVSPTFPTTSGGEGCADMGNIFDIMMSSEPASESGGNKFAERDVRQTLTVFNSISQAVLNLGQGVRTPIVCMKDIFRDGRSDVRGAKIINPTMQSSPQPINFGNHNTRKERFGASENSKQKVLYSPGFLLTASVNAESCLKSQLSVPNTDRQTSRLSTSGMSTDTGCSSGFPKVSLNDKLTVPSSVGRSPEKRKRSPNKRLGSDMFLFPWHSSRRPRDKSSENKDVKKLAKNSNSPGVKISAANSSRIKDNTSSHIVQASSTSKTLLVQDSLIIPTCTTSSCNVAQVRAGESLKECAGESSPDHGELSNLETKTGVEMQTKTLLSNTIHSGHSSNLADQECNAKRIVVFEGGMKDKSPKEESVFKVSCSTQTEQCAAELKVKYECLPSTSAASDSEMIVTHSDDSMQDNVAELTGTGRSVTADNKADSRLLSLIDRMTARVGKPVEWQDLPSSPSNDEEVLEELHLHLSACSSPCEIVEEESSLEESSMNKSLLEDSSLKETSMEMSSVEMLSAKGTSMDKSSLQELPLKETSMDESFLEESSVGETFMDKSSLEESSLKETSLDLSSLEEVSLKETYVEKSCLEESSLEETSLDKSSLEESSFKETSSDKSSVQESSLRETFMDKHCPEESSLKETSMDKPFLQDSSWEETSVGKSLGKLESVEVSSMEKSAVEMSSVEATCGKFEPRPSTSVASFRDQETPASKIGVMQGASDTKKSGKEAGEVVSLNRSTVKVIDLCSSEAVELEAETDVKTSAAVNECQNTQVNMIQSDCKYTGSSTKSGTLEGMTTNQVKLEREVDGNIVTNKQGLESSDIEFDGDCSDMYRARKLCLDFKINKVADTVHQDDDLSYGQRTREPAPLSVLSRVESLSSPKAMSAFMSENLESYLQSDDNRKICLASKENSMSEKNNHTQITETVANDLSKEGKISEPESTDYRINRFNPDFDDVEGMLFVSFDSKEAMEAHIRIEKQNHWDDNNFHFLDMCKLHKAASLKKRLGISGKMPKFLREKEQNYRGIHMKWFKYLRLFNRELSKLTGKPMKFVRHLAKSLEKTNDITKIKGWKNKFVDYKNSGEGVGVSNGLPLQQTGKLHWRTEQRLLRSLAPEDIKEMGLDLKKKRRKNMIFTHRKGSSAKFEGRVGRFGRVQKPRFGQDDEYYYGDEEKYYEDDGDVREKAKEEDVHIKTEGGNSVTGVSANKPSLKKKLMKKYNLCGRKRLKKMWKRRVREGKLAALKLEEESVGMREQFPILTERMALHAVSVLYCDMLGVQPQGLPSSKEAYCPENNGDLSCNQLSAAEGRGGRGDADSGDSGLSKGRKENEEDFSQSLCGKPGCRYGCVCHLFRDRAVSGSRGSDSDEVHKEDTNTVCEKEYCRLGCICSSLERQLASRQAHCGKAECMFECQCEDKELNLLSLLSPSGSDDIPLLQAVTDSLKSRETVKRPDAELPEPEAAPSQLLCPDLAKVEKKTMTAPKKRFANLPKRVGSQRVAKNLDAITRKAMMYMDPDDLFPKPKRRRRKKDEITADEQRGKVKSPGAPQPKNAIVIYEQVDEVIENAQVFPDDTVETSLQGSAWGCSRTSIFNPVRKPRTHGFLNKNNHKDKAVVIDLVPNTQRNTVPPQDTVFIQKCFKNTALPQAQHLGTGVLQQDSKEQVKNNVINISDDDSDQIQASVPPGHSVAHPSIQSHPTREEMQRRKKRKRKQRLEKTLLDGYGSPDKMSTESSDGVSGGVTTVKIPVWEEWSTNMVCIKPSKKRKSIPSSEERKTSSEHHLLEIRSNCNWDLSRKMVLSAVDKCLRPYEYPDPQIFEIQNYTVEILPKASEPAKIPTNFRASFPSVMYTVRITVTPTWFHRKSKVVEETKKDKAPEMTASKQLCLRLLQEQHQKAARQQHQSPQLYQQKLVKEQPTVPQPQQPVSQQLDPACKSSVTDTPQAERSQKENQIDKHFQPVSGISGLGKLKVNNSFIQLTPNVSQQNSVFRLKEGQVTFRSSVPSCTSLATATGKNTPSGSAFNISKTPGSVHDSSACGTLSVSMTTCTMQSKPSTHTATEARAITSVSLSSQNTSLTASVPSSKPMGIRPSSLPTMQLIQNGVGMPKLVPVSAGKVGNMPLLQLFPMANAEGPRGATPVRMQGQPATTTATGVIGPGNKNYVAFPVILQTVNPSGTSGGGAAEAKASGGLTLRASNLPSGCVMTPTQSSMFPVKIGTEQRPVFLAPITVQPSKPGVIPTTVSFPAPIVNDTNCESHKDKDTGAGNSTVKTDKPLDSAPEINLDGRRELYSVLTQSKAPSPIKSASCQDNNCPGENKVPGIDSAASGPVVNTSTGKPDIVCDSSTENTNSEGVQMKQVELDQIKKKSVKPNTEASKLENDEPEALRKDGVKSSRGSSAARDSIGGDKPLVEVRSLLNTVTEHAGDVIDLTDGNSNTPCAIETSDADKSGSRSLKNEKQSGKVPAGIPDFCISKYTLEKPVLINIQKLMKKSLSHLPKSSDLNSPTHSDGPRQISPTAELKHVTKFTTLNGKENCSDSSSDSAAINKSAEVDFTVSSSGTNTLDSQASSSPQGTGIVETSLSQGVHLTKAKTSPGALTSEQMDSYSLDGWSDISVSGDSLQESRITLESSSDEGTGQKFGEEEEEVDVEGVSEHEATKRQSRRKSPIRPKTTEMDTAYSELVMLYPGSSTKPQKIPSNRHQHLFRERKRRNENRKAFARLCCVLSNKKKSNESKPKIQILTEACALIEILTEDQLTLRRVLDKERNRRNSLQKQLALARGLACMTDEVIAMNCQQTDEQTNRPDSRHSSESSQGHHKVVESMTLDDGSSLQILLSDAELDAEDSGETTVSVSQENSEVPGVSVKDCSVTEPDSSVTTPKHSPSIPSPTTQIQPPNTADPANTGIKQNPISKNLKDCGIRSRSQISNIKQFGNYTSGLQTPEKTAAPKAFHMKKTSNALVIASGSQKAAVDITQLPTCKVTGERNTTTVDLQVQDPSVMSSVPVVSAVLRDDVITLDEKGTEESILHAPVIEMNDDFSGEEQLSNVSSSLGGKAPVIHTGGLDLSIQSRDHATDVKQQAVEVFDVESVFQKIKKPRERSPDSGKLNSESLALDSEGVDSTEDSDVLVSERTCASLTKNSQEPLYAVNIDKESRADPEVGCQGDGLFVPEVVGLEEPAEDDSLVILDVCSLADWSAV